MESFTKEIEELNFAVKRRITTGKFWKMVKKPNCEAGLRDRQVAYWLGAVRRSAKRINYLRRMLAREVEN